MYSGCSVLRLFLIDPMNLQVAYLVVNTAFTYCIFICYVQYFVFIISRIKHYIMQNNMAHESIICASKKKLRDTLTLPYGPKLYDDMNFVCPSWGAHTPVCLNLCLSNNEWKTIAKIIIPIDSDKWLYRCKLSNNGFAKYNIRWAPK